MALDSTPWFQRPWAVSMGHITSYYISWDQRTSSFHWINRCIITIDTTHQLLQTFPCIINPYHLRSYDKIRNSFSLRFPIETKQFLYAKQILYITGFKKWKYCRFESAFPQLWSVCSRSYCDYKQDDAIPKNKHDSHLSTHAERAPVAIQDYSLRLPGLSLSWAPQKSLLRSHLRGQDSSQKRVKPMYSGYRLSFCYPAIVVNPSQQDALHNKATPADKLY